MSELNKPEMPVPERDPIKDRIAERVWNDLYTTFPDARDGADDQWKKLQELENAPTTSTERKQDARGRYMHAARYFIIIATALEALDSADRNIEAALSSLETRLNDLKKEIEKREEPLDQHDQELALKHEKAKQCTDAIAKLKQLMKDASGQTD